MGFWGFDGVFLQDLSIHAIFYYKPTENNRIMKYAKLVLFVRFVQY